MEQYRKAIFGGLTAGLTALGTALADGRVTPLEGAGIALAVVVAAAAVWAVRNGPAPESTGAHRIGD